MSKRSHISTALTTGLLAAVALPAVADAAPIKLVQYDVEAEATLQHKHGYLFANTWEQFASNVDLNSKLRSNIGTVTFRDGKPRTVKLRLPKKAASAGRARASWP